MSGRRLKVVITDGDYPSIDPEREVLLSIADLFKYDCISEEDVIRCAWDADGIIVDYAPITRRVIENLPRLKVVSRYGIGVDNVDVQAATEKGIVVTNVVYDVSSIAEHTLALLLACWRKLTQADMNVRRGVWSYRSLMPIRLLKSSTVGIVGLGRIGREVAKRLKFFNTRIIAYDPYVEEKVFYELGIEKVELDYLLRESDAILIHTPLTRETYHLINEEKLRLMKPTAILVNTARGPVVDCEALYKALREGWIASVALDVVEGEPLKLGDKLLSLGNLLITPHMAWYSEETIYEIQRKAALNVLKVLMGETPESIVNPEVWKKE
ncbi:MAG: C-terminal binding protein [Nitrososphaerota archaeon]